MKPIVINSQSFEHEVIESDQLTIVDFWAPWCGPCKMIAPILDEIASRYDGTLKVTKLNVDENAVTSQRFGITSIPTLLFFSNGQVVDRLIGAIPRNQLEARINRLFSLSTSAEVR
ncbi:MAG: thioredoxin [Ignavibacteriae bacterium]|nr:thioredoxin [Ignavibacteria bacterium]MBI3365815.1 thioredoxin [Ignavibacteriota bacterium]